MTAKLNVNIDHVATIREARRTIEPSVVEAARICEAAGAHGITVHIRGDRRHIQDSDIKELRAVVKSYLNVEMAATDEMIAIALSTKPDAVSLVPESPNEVTTEGGLDVVANFETVKSAVTTLNEAGIFTSLFVDPDLKQIEAAHATGAKQVELCTAEYAHMTLGGTRTTSSAIVGSSDETFATPTLRAEAALIADEGFRVPNEISRIRSAAAHASSLTLKAAAGHGLTYRNVRPLSSIPEITEFNIGHNIISRAVFVGLNQAVKEMIEAIGEAND